MQRSRRVTNLLACAALAVAMASAPAALGETPPAPDVRLNEPPAPQRVVTIEWQPLTILLSKVSADIIVSPGNHHALVLVPFYASTTTAPVLTSRTDAAGNGIQLPEQTFRGFGGEIGYRYYLGMHGPRGLFVGPSLMFGSMTAVAANGTQTPFWSYGLALDVGYQALVGERIALSIGAGAEYQTTDKEIPRQQLPASLYANRGFEPRILLALGYAF